MQEEAHGGPERVVAVKRLAHLQDGQAQGLQSEHDGHLSDQSVDTGSHMQHNGLLSLEEHRSLCLRGAQECVGKATCGIMPSHSRGRGTSFPPSLPLWLQRNPTRCPQEGLPSAPHQHTEAPPPPGELPGRPREPCLWQRSTRH